MRTTLFRTSVAEYFVAGMAVGAMLLPAAMAQTSAHKKSSGKSNTASHASSTHSAASSPNQPAKATTAKSGKSSSRKTSKTKKVKGQAAPTPERIAEIQDALAKRGILEGTSSGKWDDSTAEALKKFQASNHLNPNGKIDALTLQKLGLGSETAGLAAPTPPPNSVANRLLSRNTHPDPDPDDNN
jgi:hypothetical protein